MLGNLFVHQNKKKQLETPPEFEFVNNSYFSSNDFDNLLDLIQAFEFNKLSYWNVNLFMALRYLK